MRTNEEFAIMVTDIFDDGFFAREEYTYGVLDIYSHLEKHDFKYVSDLLMDELDNRDAEDAEDIIELLNELKLKERLYEN